MDKLTPQSMQQAAGSLTHNEKTRLRTIVSSLESLIDKPDITEDSYKAIKNIQTEIFAISEIYTLRIINLLKRGYEI